MNKEIYLSGGLIVRGTLEQFEDLMSYSERIGMNIIFNRVSAGKMFIVEKEDSP